MSVLLGSRYVTNMFGISVRMKSTQNFELQLNYDCILNELLGAFHLRGQIGKNDSFKKGNHAFKNGRLRPREDNF